MTRINCVPPEKLHPKHLVAEYRELPRVFKLIEAAQERGEAIDDKRNPTSYVLGTGHVRFFYDKALFLLRRQQSLIREMRNRGFDPKFTYPNDLVRNIDDNRFNHWEPTDEALALNRERLEARKPKD